MSLIFQTSGKYFEGNFKRIVSVVPSQTELLFDLGLDEEVVGITKFCVHPEAWFRNKTRIGGTKKLNIEKIISLKPDLVLANKEENLQTEIEQLSNHTNVWVSEIENLNDALDMIKQVGIMCSATTESEKMINDIAKSFAMPAAKLHSAIYLIWNEPMMTIGGDTFIHDMMLRFGYHNLFAHQSRYPTVTTEELIALNPECLLLSSEPFPFNEKHKAYFEKLLPHCKVMLVDGEMFSWYGSRLLLAKQYIKRLMK